MLKPKRSVPTEPYLVAVLSVVLATLLTNEWHVLRDIHSLAAYMAAVVITASVGGMMPAVLSMALSAASFAYFIAPPEGLSIGSSEDRIRLASFLIVGFLFSFLHSARMNAEAKVRSLVQRLRLALDGTKMGLWDLSLDTGVVWHSLTMEEIFARRGERFSQAYEVFIGYIHPEDRDFVHRTFMHSIEQGEEFNIQYRIMLPEGDMRWVSTRGRVFFDAKGHPERLVAATSDMTNSIGAAVAPAAKLTLTKPGLLDEALAAAETVAQAG